MIAVALILLVLGCPLADNSGRRSRGLARLVAVFARDVVVRRTAIACALALGVSARTFFRTPPVPRSSRTSSKPLPPSGDGVGA